MLAPTFSQLSSLAGLKLSVAEKPYYYEIEHLNPEWDPAITYFIPLLQTLLQTIANKLQASNINILSSSCHSALLKVWPKHKM